MKKYEINTKLNNKNYKYCIIIVTLYCIINYNIKLLTNFFYR